MGGIGKKRKGGYDCASFSFHECVVPVWFQLLSNSHWRNQGLSAPPSPNPKTHSSPLKAGTTGGTAAGNDSAHNVLV